MSDLSLRGIQKSFNAINVIPGVSVEIADGDGLPATVAVYEPTGAKTYLFDGESKSRISR